jgi:hypothetical protein
MAAIIVLGIVLAFVLFGALERLVPKAEKLLGALSGITFVLLALWGIYLGGSWGLQNMGVSSDQLIAYLGTASLLPVFTEQAAMVLGIAAWGMRGRDQSFATRQLLFGKKL